MKTFISYCKKELEDYKLLVRNIPAVVVALFVVSVILMNLLANKEIQTGIDWLALDCGLLVSWLSFLAMDMITKRYGAKASVKISILAVCINLLVCLILLLASHIPGNWAASYEFDFDAANSSLNSTFGGTWYVLLGSTIAFLVSAVVNSFLNAVIGNLLRNNNFKDYAIRSYISTLIGQFVDNFVFAFIVSHNFFGWSMLQCITCSLTGCIVELLCEVIFSPIGYRVCKKWEIEDVGSEYIMKSTYVIGIDLANTDDFTTNV